MTNKKDRSVYTLVQDGITYLDSRTEFWRQQKPIYARKREKELKKWRPPPTRPQNPVSRSRGGEVEYTKYILKSLEEIDNGNLTGTCTHYSTVYAQTTVVIFTVYVNCDIFLPLIIVHTIAISVGDINQILALSEKALETVNSLTEDSLPNKQQFLATLYSCIGTAHLELGHVKEAMEQFNKDMEIAEKE